MKLINAEIMKASADNLPDLVYFISRNILENMPIDHHNVAIELHDVITDDLKTIIWKLD